MMTENGAMIGIDIGGTKILSARIENGIVLASKKLAVPKEASQDEILDVLFKTINQVITDDVLGIGIGVPSVVDVKKGIVYDVQNIPSWKEVSLGDILNQKYDLPVYVNNDANCFAAGEKFYGKGKKYTDIAAVIIGTGMAAGLVLNDQLYNGSNCGAGEFGMLPYLDQNYEYYASGQFFENEFNVTGQQMHEKANSGDDEAIKAFSTYGIHLGNALNAVLYAIDPQIIILGGSVSKAFEYFEKTMRSQISKIAYGIIAQRIKIEVSSNPDIAVLGAAALLLNSRK